MELGSEFALETVGEPCPDNLFTYLADYQTIYTDSGRSATQLLAGILPPGPILLPAYICESVCTCFPDRPLIFYGLTETLEIDWNDLFRKLSGNVSVLYLHYFNGILPDGETLRKLWHERKEKHFWILEDTTHSLFSAPLTMGDYGICSLRKWFPIPDGGVLYAPSPANIPMNILEEAPWSVEKRHAMALKADYLAGKRGEDCNTEYRRLFAACDEGLERQTSCFSISAFSRSVLASCSVSKMTAARKRNYTYLRDALRRMPAMRLIAQTKQEDCPFVCPVRVSDRDDLRSYLISKKIYCAVHWPLQGTPMEKTAAAHIAREELSFPIDQRYGPKELTYLIEQLQQYRSA